jgi:hypothetical protein
MPEAQTTAKKVSSSLTVLVAALVAGAVALMGVRLLGNRARPVPEMAPSLWSAAGPTPAAPALPQAAALNSVGTAPGVLAAAAAPAAAAGPPAAAAAAPAACPSAAARDEEVAPARPAVPACAAAAPAPRAQAVLTAAPAVAEPPPARPESCRIEAPAAPCPALAAAPATPACPAATVAAAPAAPPADPLGLALAEPAPDPAALEAGLLSLGVIVKAATPGGAGQQAGLAEGDRIVTVTGQPVVSVLHFFYLLAQHAGERPARLGVVRQGKLLQLDWARPAVRR